MQHAAKKTASALIMLLIAGFFAGCADYKAMEKTVDRDVQATTKRIESAKKLMPINRRDNGRSTYIRKSSKPFIAKTSVPKSSSETLPPQLSRVTINLPGRYTLAQAAQIIIETTGIPVALSEDINPASSTAKAQQPANTQSGTSQMQAMQADAEIAKQFPIVLGYTNIPLANILDEIGAAAGGLSWEYNNGRINFYRFVTKTFTLTVPTFDPTTEMKVGMNGQMQTGSTSVASSTNTGSTDATFSANFVSTMKAWDEAIDSIQKGILSPSGKVIASRTAQTVTVTDGRRQVDQAERFVEELNKIYERQIAVHIEVISLTQTEASEFGINWALVLSKINANGNNIQFALSSPVGAADPNAASAGVKIIKQVNGQLDFSTSQAVVTALSSVGVVSQRRSLDTIAMNRRVTPVASLRNTAYIAATTPATATAGGTGGVPGLTPGNISYGFSLSMIPTITSNNAVILDFGLLQSDLIAMVSKSSGTGINQQTLELPDVVAQQLVQALKLNTGDTLVISGLEQDTNQYDKRTLSKELSPAMGGMFRGSTGRQSLVVLITPLVD